MASRLQPKHKAPLAGTQRTNNPSGKRKDGARPTPKRMNLGMLIQHDAKQAPGRRRMPLEILEDIANASPKTMPTTFRLQAAAAAAPYRHRKMPIAIEGTDKPIPIVNAAALAAMSTEQLAAMAAALATLGLDASTDEDQQG